MAGDNFGEIAESGGEGDRVAGGKIDSRRIYQPGPGKCVAYSGEDFGQCGCTGESNRARALRSDDAQSVQSELRDFVRRRDFPRAMDTNSSWGLCRRSEPHASDRWRWSFVCRSDGGSVSTANE